MVNLFDQHAFNPIPDGGRKALLEIEAGIRERADVNASSVCRDRRNNAIDVRANAERCREILIYLLFQQRLGVEHLTEHSVVELELE